MFSRLKISTNLLLISTAFLLPIIVMLTIIIDSAYSDIKLQKIKLEHIMELRPFAVLSEILPRHARVRFGYDEGDLVGIGAVINEQIRSLSNRDNQIKLVTAWEQIYNAPTSNLAEKKAVLYSYLQYVKMLNKNLVQIGENGKLYLTDDMSIYYFADATLNGLPQTFEQLMAVGTFLRNIQTTIDETKQKTALTTQQAYDLTDLIAILQEADRRRLMESLRNAIETLGARDEQFHKHISSSITPHMVNYDASMDDLGAKLNTILKQTQLDLAPAMRAVAKSNEATYELWNAILDELEILLEDRVQATYTALIRTLSIVLIIVALAFTIVFFSTRRIHQSSQNIRHIFTAISNHDLSSNFNIVSRDEFGEFMQIFNNFLFDLRAIFDSFKSNMSLVTSSAFELSSSVRDISATANEQSAGVSEIVSTMEGNKNLSKQVAQTSVEASSLADQTQMLSRKGAELRDENQALMEEIRAQNSEIISAIRSLTEMIFGISEAIVIIDSIADQTKLIAFNASLEASSAGESGARFAVVAAEIRRFADSVTESTKEIKAQIEAAQNESQALIARAANQTRRIDSGALRMGEQKVVFEEIVTNSQNVAVSYQQISNLSKQQEYASSQIFETLKEISAGVRQFVLATSSTGKIADQLSAMADSLNVTLERYKTK
ncbi:hypothetical protein AGMMS50229_00260 [Campylobacterota bacterium]|nr:hypothetical protein AGMMS50229_00260 [Campylobacterota bacterium]